MPFDILNEYNLLRKESETNKLKELPSPIEISEEQAALNLDYIAKLREKIGIPMSKVLPGSEQHAQKVKQQAYEVLYGQRGY